MTTDEILDSIIQKEGGFADLYSDRGGPTNFGISSVTLGEWRRLGRAASRAEVKALQLPEARDIYRARYCRHFDAVPFDGLKAQLVDFGVLSGVLTAIKALQQVLGVTVDGVMGPRTLTALSTLPWPLVNNALVGVRVKLFSDIAEKDATQRQFIRGWICRAVSFIV